MFYGSTPDPIPGQIAVCPRTHEELEEIYSIICSRVELYRHAIPVEETTTEVMNYIAAKTGIEAFFDDTMAAPASNLPLDVLMFACTVSMDTTLEHYHTLLLKSDKRYATELPINAIDIVETRIGEFTYCVFKLPGGVTGAMNKFYSTTSVYRKAFDPRRNKNVVRPYVLKLESEETLIIEDVGLSIYNNNTLVIHVKRGCVLTPIRKGHRVHINEASSRICDKYATAAITNATELSSKSILNMLELNTDED